MTGREHDSGAASDAASPYSAAGPSLIAHGYSAIPISPADKMPGRYSGGAWWPMKEWSRYCGALPAAFEVKLWSGWPDANVGVACGRGLLAFDIDREDLVEPIKAVLPPVVVAKRGRKGETLFFRGDTTAIRSRGFKIDKGGVLDLIADGKQTVVPPSIHPDTGAPYTWTTERTLLDTPLAALPEVTTAHVEAVIDVLRAHGYEAAEPIRPREAAGFEPASSDDVGAWYRRLNDDALANLDAWVPRLGLTRLVRAGDGYRSVAEWRPSNSGKPIGRRRLLLSIDPKGIVDYGDGDKGYTAVNLVMAALGYGDADLDKASVWLGEAIGYDFSPVILNAARKHLPTRYQAHRFYEIERSGRGSAAAREGWLTSDEQACRVWSEAVDPRGTAAETYLRTVGLALSPDLAGRVLRFHSGLGKDGSGSDGAALVALVRNVYSNQPQGVRCIFVDHSGGTSNEERHIGTGVQGAVKLDDDAETYLGLTIGQGLENCMAWRQLGFRPTWVVSSAGSIHRFPILPGIDGLTILVTAQRNVNNRRAAAKCADRWHLAGRTTALAEPRVGSNMLDVLRRAS